MLNKILFFFGLKKRPAKTSNKSRIEFKVIDNLVETRANIVKAIIAVLTPLRYGEINLGSLNIYFNKQECDNIIAVSSAFSDAQFEEDLRTRLENERIYLGDNWTWNYVEADIPVEVTSIGHGLYISIQSTHEVGTKAYISEYIGKLEQQKYVLDASGKSRFNIGRGKVSLKNGRYHENYIVIKDSPDFGNEKDDKIKINQFVSSEHATIVYSKNTGFSLRTLRGGCEEGGNRTRIIRENKPPRDLQSTAIEIPLKDKDLIELGKSVFIRFGFNFDKEEPTNQEQNDNSETSELQPEQGNIRQEEQPKQDKTEHERAIDAILFDYCIIDTNIWMETNDIQSHHAKLIRLKDLYAKNGKKLIAHGSTYEELKKFSDEYWKKIEEREKGLDSKISPKEYCGAKGFSLLKRFFQDKIVRIPGLESTHNADAYADKDIYDFASEEFEKGKSILFISNDIDCGMRVNSRLDDLKNKNQLLPNFDVLNMAQAGKLIDCL